MNIPPLTVQAVLFDMDGLMINSEQLVYEIMRDYYGADFPIEFYTQLIGISDAESQTLLRDGYPDRYLDTNQLMQEYNRRIEAGHLQAKPGLIALLDTLDLFGIPKAVASSNKLPPIERCLQSIGVRDRFEVIVCDGMGARCKPAPDLFLRAAELLRQPPQHCLVLEDSAAGIRAGHAAECPVIMVPDLFQPTQEIEKLCHAVVPSLFVVNEFILRLYSY